MPNPIDCLRIEHGACRTACRILLRMADHVERGLPFPAADCAVVLRFLRDFADGVHGRKETEHVFAALAIYGDESTVELTGALLRHQQQCRDLLLALGLFWEPTAALTAAEREGFVEAARAFAGRSLAAIAVEEGRLFPAAECLVPADDRLAWTEVFDRIEADRVSLSCWQSRLAPLADRWR
jgi:hemerythrin-like domain-containing protein